MATIKDVARIAGVSVSTVSHVVNGTRYVSPEKVRKVEDAIRQLDELPNFIAKRSALKSKLSENRYVLILLSKKRSLFQNQVKEKLEEIVEQKGYIAISLAYDLDEDRLAAIRALARPDAKEIPIIALTANAFTEDALRAADMLREEGVSAEVINIHTLKPVDRQAVLKSVKKTGRALTVENHSVFGGLHSAVCEILCEEFPVRCAAVAVNDRFGEVGRLNELKRFYGLTDRDIADKAKTLL